MKLSVSTAIHIADISIQLFYFTEIQLCPVVKILPSNAGGVGLISDWGAKIPIPLGQKTKT